MTDNGQYRKENIASDEIEELQQDENLTPADRMDLIANSVAQDEDPDASADAAGAVNGEPDTRDTR
jgi:hypothetical protein